MSKFHIKTHRILNISDNKWLSWETCENNTEICQLLGKDHKDCSFNDDKIITFNNFKIAWEVLKVLIKQRIKESRTQFFIKEDQLLEFIKSYRMYSYYQDSTTKKHSYPKELHQLNSYAIKSYLGKIYPGMHLSYQAAIWNPSDRDNLNEGYDFVVGISINEPQIENVVKNLEHVAASIKDMLWTATYDSGPVSYENRAFMAIGLKNAEDVALFKLMLDDNSHICFTYLTKSLVWEAYREFQRSLGKSRDGN